jgi:hypothetical protein
MVYCLLLVLRRLPFDPFEVEYKNCVEDRDQEQGDERGDGESADLGIAKRFPERAAFECERKQGQNRRLENFAGGTGKAKFAEKRLIVQRAA